MPKVCLTESQRQEAAIQATYQKVVDGVAAYQNRKQMTNEQLAAELGISRNSIPKLLHADSLHLDVRTLLKVLHLAGMEVKRRDP